MYIYHIYFVYHIIKHNFRYEQKKYVLRLVYIIIFRLL